MKPVLVILSIICLSFTFTQDYFDNQNTAANATAPAAAAEASTEPVTGNKPASVSDVVTTALALKAMLSGTALSSLQQTYTTTLARNWSNLPCGASCRNGVEFSSLSAAQLDAAKAVIRAAAGIAPNEGYDEFIQIITADSILGVSSGGGGMGGGAYSKGNYFICFLNNPSNTDAWMLQFGGHHYAANIAFNNGQVLGATPRFEGVEPRTFTAANGSVYAPIDQERAAMLNLFTTLSASQLTTAKITGSFTDVLLGPGQDGKFPATKAGIQVSTLSATQQALVMDAMKPWVNDADTATVNALLAIYQSELANTYIGYAGNSGSAMFTAQGDYVRIDGPSVWIEFVCQNGVVFPSQIHFHTIWRDHTRDYGKDLTGAPVTGTSGGVSVQGISNLTRVAVYPNPAGDFINVSVPQTLKAAGVKVLNIASGQTAISVSNYSGAGVGLDVSKLPAGLYMIRIEDAGSVYAGKFTKL